MELIQDDSARDRGILLVTGLVIFAAWLQGAIWPEYPGAALLNGIQWTLAYVTAAWLGWSGSLAKGISPQQRTVRRRFAIALVAQAVGQIGYDAESAAGWWPTPGPDDVCFFAFVGWFFYGLAAVPGTTLTASLRRLLLLDIASFALAVLALALTLYLPHGDRGDLPRVAVVTAYPVLMLSTAATAAVIQLHLRQRGNARWLALLAGLLGMGVLCLAWLIHGELDQLEPLTDLGYSVFALLMGWGAAGWQADPDPTPGFDRLCEGLLRQLPLALVALATLTIGLIAVAPALGDSLRIALAALALSVIVFAVVRQTGQLRERDRMIEAERRAAESQARLQHLAHHDPLTGLPNRTLLRDRVQRALSAAQRRNSRTALLFLDMDQFKEVNDSLGHAIGDALLRHVAGLLLEAVRTADTVSRQGGDEFAIVLPEVEDIDGVVRVAEKIMQISAGTAQIEGHELRLSMSVGVALYPDNASDFDSLLQCADAAMYRAKAAGRNAYRFYDAQMHAESSERVQLRVRLGRALERGELQLLFQPMVQLRSGRVCGAEALLRWRSAELGEVAPAAFLPVAEDSGLIVDIGAWVLEKACQEAARWRENNLPDIPVAVNVAGLQFRRGGLEAQVRGALERTALPASALEIEVTESVLMHDADRVIATLERLAASGVGVAIDDFGTGYSSLSHVRRMRVRKLKIDGSFVRGAAGDATTAAVVRATVDMGRALGLATVAEGVENDEQLGFLRACRCSMGQGSLFSPPLAAEDFARYLAGQS